ncbi:MAG: TlpA family protein disulfide reductase [Tannerella sp.]|jgi:thiol-disulfide isomerase/thioredoxin|nr:TlpA family protein disulfide reductase [Tannerella sp.]
MKLTIPSAKILVEPGNTYRIVMDISKKDVQISGANEKGQMLYTSLPNPFYIGMEADKLNLKKDTSLFSIHAKVEELKQSDLSKFRELLDKEDISQSFFDLIKIDRDCYYASLEAGVSLSKLHRMPETKQFVLPSGENVLDNLRKIYTQYPPNSEQLIFSSFWCEYAEHYVKDYSLFIKEDFDVQKTRDLYENGMIHTSVINESKNSLTGKVLEFFQATYLYFTSLHADHEKELIALFEQFEKDYPNSEYTRYIKPLINEIVLYHQAVEKPFAENVRFLAGYENICTLEEAIKPLKGKKIYIDIWATWCGPCKREFKHQQELKKMLDRQNIQQLYISIDMDDQDLKWKECIKFYGLSGTHIRANRDLSMDLYKLFDKKAKGPDYNMSIPWYITVDENGNTVKEHAKTPSEIVSNPEIIKEIF